MNIGDVISLGDAMRMAGRSYQSLYLWLKEEDAPKKIKLGRRLYFNRAEFTAWLQARLPR